MDMRTQFEHWFSDQGSNLRAIEKAGGEYKLMQAESSWLAWQAGWNQSQPAAPQVTQEMVDAAFNIVYAAGAKNLQWSAMRAALEAALAQPSDVPDPAGGA